MTRVKITFMGPFNVTFTVQFYVQSAIVNPNDALILAVISAIETMCACVALKIELSIAATAESTAGSGILVAQDKLQVTVADAEDNRHTYRIPAPYAAGTSNPFAADLLTFDTESTSGAALSAAIESVAKSQAGGALTPIIEGHRTEGKPLKN